MASYMICPFFRYERYATKYHQVTISCEDGTMMRFPSRKHANMVANRFCSTFDYMQCKHAQRIQAKYDRKESGGGSI